MIRKTLFLFVLLFLGYSLSGQQLLMLKKPGKIKYFKYHVGDEIVFRIKKHDDKIYGVIYQISDTSIVINGKNEVMLADISKVYRDRWGLRLLQVITRYAGIGFVGLDAVNRTINGQGPIFQKQTLIISGSLLAFSYALYPFRIRSMVINKPWILQTLDFSWD